MNNETCRISGTKLKGHVDFGRQPLGNGFLSKEEFKEEYFFPMSVGFSEESLMFQLLDQPSAEKMFHEEYAFYSSTSVYMAQHFKDFANQVKSSKYLSNTDPFVVELGCNDGIMLKNFVDDNIRHLGIEPSLNVARVANEKGVQTVSEFFCNNLAQSIVSQYGQADVFLAANVMCHIPNINDVVEGINTLLKPDGVVMFEDPYLGDVVEKTSYDQIYDEHVFLFSALSIQKLFSPRGFELIDLIPQVTHGGSMRYVLARKGKHPISDSVSNILGKEIRAGLDNLQMMNNFRKKVEKSKNDLINLLHQIKSEGKSICGYAATSKSTTILNYCGIGPDLIDYISDTTPIKQGKYSPGMHIPVLPHQAFKDNPPDYAFLFAWNHSQEIMAKEKEFTERGGRWITHVPDVRII